MQTYTHEQALAASLEYFKGDDLAADVFVNKYALKDLEDRIYELTPEDMHRRLAKEFARIEKKYPNPLSEEEIFKLFSDWTVVPQGSPMAGIGNPFQLQSLSNCFVIQSPADSYGGIFMADQEQAQIMKRRGGVGQDISCIRPKGLPAANAARSTDGIGVFMDRYSNTTREVAQEGRRGALMISILCHHPEVETFINIKRDRKRVTGANVSVRITNEFMRAVESGGKVELRWPVDSPNPQVRKTVDAEVIWNQIIQCAWESAEPGVLFWDHIIDNSPADCYALLGYATKSTNPCGELPLSPYDSCRLLLLNLLNFVKNPFTKDASFEFKRFADVAFKAQKLMDDLVDLELEMIDKIIDKVEKDPEDPEVKVVELNLWKKIKKYTGDGRRTGLGITALGDCLAALGIKYGSDLSISTTEDIYKILATESYVSSIFMAQDRGPFPVWDLELEKNHPFINKILDEIGSNTVEEIYYNHGRRNIANLTTSPAGSLSTMTQTTSGCEPAVFLSYVRRRKVSSKNSNSRVDFIDELGDKWQEYRVYHHGLKKWAEINGKDVEKDIRESPYWGATAEEIDWVKKVDMQAAAQRWVDHSISNTTNLPASATVEDVKQVYMHAWKTGCKGVTVYRSGSRSGVLVSTEGEKKTERGVDTIKQTQAPKRPLELSCDIHRAKVKGEEYLILVGLLNNQPYEIFCGLANQIEDLGKKQTKGKLVKTPKKNDLAIYDLHVGDQVFHDVVNLFDNPIYGAFTRTISTALRHGVPIHYLVEQLRKDKHSDITSFSSVIARVLAKSYIADGTKSADQKKCNECGSANVAYLQGCTTCLDCGGSKCG